MDAKLLIALAALALFAAFAIGYMRGTRFGVRVAVKSYLKEEGAYDKPVPAAWTEYYNDTRRELGGEDTAAARAWTRKHKLPFNAETLALFNDSEYRKGVDGDELPA